MLTADETQASLIGAWRLMLGKVDGLRLLDLSADGFWNSFFAIVIAAPALIVGWVGIANEIGDHSRISRIILRNACFYFTDKISAHVSSLGENTTTHTHEQGK